MNLHNFFIVERGQIHLALEINLKRIFQPLDITFNIKNNQTMHVRPIVVHVRPIVMHVRPLENLLQLCPNIPEGT